MRISFIVRLIAIVSFLLGSGACRSRQSSNLAWTIKVAKIASGRNVETEWQLVGLDPSSRNDHVLFHLKKNDQGGYSMVDKPISFKSPRFLDKLYFDVEPSPMLLIMVDDKVIDCQLSNIYKYTIDKIDGSNGSSAVAVCMDSMKLKDDLRYSAVIFEINDASEFFICLSYADK